MRNKFGNRPIVLYGIEFQSTKEGMRYLQLRDLLKNEEIKDLELQPKYRFVHNDKWICTYNADFKYFDVKRDMTIVEDVKSEHTRTLPVYNIKKKMMKAYYDITVEET